MMHPWDDAGVKKPGIIKIIGIGQSLRGDDGAGLEAVRLWQETYRAKRERPNVQVELAELPGIGLLSLIEGSQLAILVDALHSGTTPGTIQLLTVNQLEAFPKEAGSAHGWGVAETLSLGMQLIPSAMPKKLILIGIEAGQFNLGETLSPQVRTALNETARLIEQSIRDGTQDE